MNGSTLPSDDRNAFTLVELLVVVSIIGLLAGLTIPAIVGARNKANDSKCLSNLRQIGLAFLSFASDNNGYLPRGNNNTDDTGSPGKEYYKAVYTYIPTLNNKMSGKQVNKVFLCPAEKQPPDQSTSCTQYTASFALETGTSATKNTGDDGNGPRTLASIENPTKTILLVDGKIGIASYAYQTESTTTWNALKADLDLTDPASTAKVSFRHLNDSAINVLFADGHIGTIKWSDRKDANLFSEPIWRGRGY